MKDALLRLADELPVNGNLSHKTKAFVLREDPLPTGIFGADLHTALECPKAEAFRMFSIITEGETFEECLGHLSLSPQRMHGLDTWKLMAFGTVCFFNEAGIDDVSSASIVSKVIDQQMGERFENVEVFHNPSIPGLLITSIEVHRLVGADDPRQLREALAEVTAELIAARETAEAVFEIAKELASINASESQDSPEDPACNRKGANDPDDEDSEETNHD